MKQHTFAKHIVYISYGILIIATLSIIFYTTGLYKSQKQLEIEKNRTFPTLQYYTLYSGNLTAGVSILFLVYKLYVFCYYSTKINERRKDKESKKALNVDDEGQQPRSKTTSLLITQEKPLITNPVNSPTSSNMVCKTEMGRSMLKYSDVSHNRFSTFYKKSDGPRHSTVFFADSISHIIAVTLSINIFITVVYWPIYLYKPEYLYYAYARNNPNYGLNIVMHIFPLVVCVILYYHANINRTYNNKYTIRLALISIIYITYIMILHYSKFKNRKYAYPVFENNSVVKNILFFIIFYMIQAGVLYLLSRKKMSF
ncbi:hypothetical protein CDIK_3767 [Cucumispora dikerogammari]|nr:hypothetical protein CDIK_3767 [Cucumispora dikerogammari]